ncbi:MAG: FAD-dependent oxidoreductase [Desulfohalobiaceae bacterium]
MLDPLFRPIKIGNLDVKNRIYLPAMHLNMAEDFQATDKICAFYQERAKGGAGMICVGFATVDQMSGSTLNIGAHKDEFIPGLSRLAQSIQQEGARAAVQLNHAGRYNFSFFMDGKQPVAPSPLASQMTRETPRELGTGEVREVVESFAAAASRVKQAGFDAVEVLAGTGYLVSEFLSPLTNQRADQYGGSEENRMRFALEIMQAIKQAAGSDFPLIVRMNGNDLMQGGMGRQELQRFALALVEQARVDALCVNVGWHEAKVPQITSAVPRGAFAYLAREIKEKAMVPVIASHRINDPWIARELISSHVCDMTAMGRALLADPYLPRKAKEGREQEIVHCIACGQGCLDNIFQLKSVECLCNPRAGHELEAGIEPAGESKKVLVAGGGPAGLSAALAATQRGHQVSLFEAQDRLGGQRQLAAAPPGRREFAVLARDLATQAERAGVEIHLGRKVDRELLEQESPDEVILATGAGPIRPDIPGVEQEHVCQAWDVLSNRAYPGRRVAVIGGGAVGVETALYLAEKGTLGADEVKFLLQNQVEDCEHLRDLCLQGTKEVVLLEMLAKLGRDIGKSTRWAMLRDLKLFGVESRTKTKALEITPEGIRVESRQGEEEFIPADSVVLAVGSRPENPLQQTVEELGFQAHVVGDAKEIGLAMQAIHKGYALGVNL